MRKGSKRNDWSVAEEQFLIANAGKLSRRELCKVLKRSTNSVRHKAQRLNVSLRCFEKTMEPCPSCGKLSATINRKGICEPCRRREQLMTINTRISELWPFLTYEQRCKYEKEDPKTGSKREPTPEPPDITRLPLHRQERLMEYHAREVEAVVTRNLTREVKALQKRKERIEKKTVQNKINGIFPD